MEDADGAGVFPDVADHFLFVLHENGRVGPALEDDGQPVFLVIEGVCIQCPGSGFLERGGLGVGEDDHHALPAVPYGTVAEERLLQFLLCELRPAQVIPDGGAHLG